MALVGGLRRRMIKHSLEVEVREALDALGWFDTVKGRKPVSFVGDPINPHVELEPNLISMSTEDLESTEWEMGSGLEEYRWDVYFDVFAQSNSVGLHIAGDLQDLLKGKMPSIDRGRPTLQVKDWRMATPAVIFTCQLENVDMQRVRNWDQPWNEFWYALVVQVVDYYDSEGDD